MPTVNADPRRPIGTVGATLVGIGGIVGGGLLILAGTAFGMAGPAAILAFALNGVVAWLTALSISEITTMFPESGGAYTFAKKVLTVRSAFVVGWVLWFAYIVAGVLYALGFGFGFGFGFGTGATCALMLLSRRMQVVSVSGVTRPLRDVAQFVPFLPRRTVDE